MVEERIKDWGLHMDSIRLQDIEMPEDLKRIMSRQASAEREKHDHQGGRRQDGRPPTWPRQPRSWNRRRAR